MPLAASLFGYVQRDLLVFEEGLFHARVGRGGRIFAHPAGSVAVAFLPFSMVRHEARCCLVGLLSAHHTSASTHGSIPCEL